MYNGGKTISSIRDAWETDSYMQRDEVRTHCTTIYKTLKERENTVKLTEENTGRIV